jgi:hypothetical protein
MRVASRSQPLVPKSEYLDSGLFGRELQEGRGGEHEHVATWYDLDADPSLGREHDTT